MPIYEYQCRACGRRSEEFQKMSDPPLTVCSECGGELRKLISAPAVQFKGSGWYVTDYAGNGGKEKGNGESGPSPGSETTAGSGNGQDKSADASASKAASKDSAGTASSDRSTSTSSSAVD
ncbi:MAG: zinc ribbon domain-containing protein [Thermoanaerobaculia bacterium]|nr:zinc ribbon domain-containing protein [Thermoanaerobaculia bacterium]